MIFEVKCDELTYLRTYGPDAHTYCLFYSIRYNTKHEEQRVILNEPKLYLRYLLCVSVRSLVRFMNSFKHFAFSISILLVLCFLR